MRITPILKTRIATAACLVAFIAATPLVANAHNIVNKTFLSFIFNGLFSC